jgi:oxaloacetate decarboxylase alpha subunit
VSLDDEALREVNEYFSMLARTEGLPAGTPQPFDARYLRHQLPGGMVGTTRRQLAEARLSHLEDAVIEELGRVREELGWPIVMTPFAQVLMTIAVMNVVQGERYKVIPDEAIRYAIGRFGRPTVPIDGQVLDRIESNPRTRELRAEPGMESLDELRRRIGADLSDEEFLLRATMPGGLVDAMIAAGPAARRYEPSEGVMNLIRQLAARRDLDYCRIDGRGIKLELRRHGAVSQVAPKGAPTAAPGTEPEAAP